MSLYWEGSSSWCSAAPTVRMRAKTSKPSNVHPRFEATSAFHCARLSERYHGEDVIVTVAVMLFLPAISASLATLTAVVYWIPAFAGMTTSEKAWDVGRVLFLALHSRPLRTARRLRRPPWLRHDRHCRHARKCDGPLGVGGDDGTRLPARARCALRHQSADAASGGERRGDCLARSCLERPRRARHRRRPQRHEERRIVEVESQGPRR